MGNPPPVEAVSEPEQPTIRGLQIAEQGQLEFVPLGPLFEGGWRGKGKQGRPDQRNASRWLPFILRSVAGSRLPMALGGLTLKCVVPTTVVQLDKGGCEVARVGVSPHVPRPHTPMHSHPLARTDTHQFGNGSSGRHIDEACQLKPLAAQADQPAYGLQVGSPGSKQGA